MLTQDFHIQSVELRNLFLAQLPQRLARLSSRGDRLHREGWDINTLYLLAADAAALANACREVEADELAVSLDALASAVAPLFDPPRVPDAAVAARIATLIAEVRDQRLPMAAQATVSQAGVVVPGPTQDQGFPLLVTPPPDYWLRFASLARTQTTPIEQAIVEEIAIAPAPELVAIPDPAEHAPAPLESAPPRATPPVHKTAYHLSRGEAPSGDIDRYLSSQGYELSPLDSTEELKELLVALPPHLVVVDAAFDDALEEIGALVKRARAEVSERLWFVALSSDSELPRRLRAVRAGVDAFIPLPASANDVIARIGELI
ncbi:MAG: hypothetical protein ABW186_12750, partial [Rhodanobacteraceae bacterium]